MRTLLVLAGLSFLVIRAGTARFGVEQITAFYRQEKVAHWILNKPSIDKITIENFAEADTLILSGFCDCGCLDGTLIRISENNKSIVNVTRRSSILHNDTVMFETNVPKKQSFVMEPVVSFKITNRHFKQLQKNKVYQVSILRVTDPKAKVLHIFDLELK